MRNLKKFLAMALTVLMVVGSFGMVATANFDDVDEYQEAVNVMTDLGIACGYEDGTFGEDDPVQRQQLALWIAKMMTGKVDTTYVTNNFVGGVNYTAFVDVEDAEDLDVYTGAINYAANNGIIVGTSATTFEPVENVLLQDVFAMAVRMLGYGSTAMNNNYPYSFIDKAISLGLDAGLGDEYIVDANATRGQTMQVLYNALTVAKSDGSTLGYDYFNVEKATVVITGTKALNVFTDAVKVSATVDAEDYVAFSMLNADGTVEGDANYYALRSEFGFDAEDDINLVLGYSYDVLTNDGFQTFITCEQNTAEVYDQTYVKGGDKDHTKDVTLGEDTYKLVKSYSDFVFGTTKKTDDKEVILYTVGTKAPSYYASSYVYDDALNIMRADDNTQVLLWWKPTYGIEGNVLNGGVYLYKLPDGNYIEPNDYIWSLAAKKTIGPEASSEGYVAITNSYTEITPKNAFSETVLFDDNNDGTWDRGIYAAYKFGKASVKDDYFTLAGATKADGAAKAAASIIYVDGEKSTLDAVKDQYVKYYYNTLTDTLFVKTIYTTQSALITGIDWANATVYFNGFGVNPFEGEVAPTTMPLGYANYIGAEKKDVAASNIGNFQELVGKKVNYIVEGDKIVRILNAADAAGLMVVVNNNVGYTTMGYRNILAYYDAAANKAASTQSIVTVGAVNNYWYSGYGAYVNGAIYNGTDFAYGEGCLLSATKDALGNYDVTEIDREDFTYINPWIAEAICEECSTRDQNDKYIEAVCACECECWNVDEDLQTKNHLDVISITNGVVSGDFDFVPFKAQADTVWVVYAENERNPDKGRFYAMTGVPGNMSIGGIHYAYVSGDDFVYIIVEDFRSFDFDSFCNNTADQWFANSTIAYVDKSTAANAYINNQMQYGLGVNFTPSFSYNKAVDMKNATYVNSAFTANAMAALQPNTFYSVTNGVISGEVAIAKAALLLEADIDSTWSYTYVDLGIKTTEQVAEILADGEYDVYASQIETEENAFPTLMWIKANGDVYAGPANALAKANDDAKNVVAAMNDVDGVEKALVVYYYETLDKDTVFLAAAPTAIKVNVSTAINMVVDETLATDVTYYAGTDFAHIIPANKLDGEPVVAGDYIVTYKVPTSTTHTITNNGVTGMYLNHVTTVDGVTADLAKIFNITFTKVDAPTNYTADFVAYKFTIDAAKDCDCKACADDNVINVEAKIDVTSAPITDDPTDADGANKDAKINFAAVWDASVTGTTPSRSEVITEIVAEEWTEDNVYGKTAKLTAAELTSGATSLADITLRYVTGRTFRIKVADNYDVAVSYIKAADLVDTTIPFDAIDTENVQGQYNYYYFTLKQDMVDTNDEIDVNIEITPKN